MQLYVLSLIGVLSLLSGTRTISAFTAPRVVVVVVTSARSTAFAPLAAMESFDTEETSTPAKEEYKEPGRNPDNPKLPELKGDYDWDEKFGADDDWITENVPGKVVLNEIDLAKQVTALDKLEEQWRKERQQKEYDSKRLLGWTDQAETYNGRYAMFFLVVGLLTEYWTGFSMPAQVEEMLRISGVIGFDG